MNLHNFLAALQWIEEVAAIVWIILSAILVCTLFKTIQQLGWRSKYVYGQIGLLVFMWLHPVYTSIIKAKGIVEIGNIATLILTVLVFYQLKLRFGSMSNWLIPQMVWLAVASLYTGLKLMAS
jgi:hypothetical protein